MTQYEKLLKKFLKNPCSLEPSDILKILEKNGFTLRISWSHHINKNWSIVINIPIHNEECLEIYKKQASKKFKKFLEENQEIDDNEDLKFN